MSDGCLGEFHAKWGSLTLFVLFCVHVVVVFLLSERKREEDIISRLPYRDALQSALEKKTTATATI